MQFPMQSFLPFANQAPYVRTIQVMFPPSLSNPWGSYPGGDPFAGGFRCRQSAKAQQCGVSVRARIDIASSTPILNWQVLTSGI